MSTTGTCASTTRCTNCRYRTYLVTRAEMIQDIVARPEVFSSESGAFLHKGDRDGPTLSSSMSGYTGRVRVLATVDPPDHGRQRKVVIRKLSTANMRPWSRSSAPWSTRDWLMFLMMAASSG